MESQGPTPKIYNLKKLRVILGLTQEEFAWLAGISGVYLSQIETGARHLTVEASEKIARALIWLRDSDENPKISDVVSLANEVRAYHLASFYPEEVQERIVYLVCQKHNIERELDVIIDIGKLPPKIFYERLSTPVYGMAMYEHMFSTDGNTEINVPLAKERFAKSRKKRPRY